LLRAARGSASPVRRAARRADLRFLDRKRKTGGHVDALTRGDANGRSCDARLDPLAVANRTHYVQMRQGLFGDEYDRGDGQRMGEPQRQLYCSGVTIAKAWLRDRPLRRGRRAAKRPRLNKKILGGSGETVAFLTIPLTALVASTVAASAQDRAAGEKVFAKCKICHQSGETAKNFVGPVLNGVVGRPAGTYPGYNYSEANKTSGFTWDEATLKVYLKNPKEKVPGTKMVFPGLPSDEVANVIAYLRQFGPDGGKV
jgi:cytochrome c